MSESQFRLPDVGEGLTEAEIVAWKVAPGDTIVVNQVIVEIETAKSLVELPSPFDGVVGRLLVDEGQTVEVGTAIITVDATGDEAELSAGSGTADSVETDLVQDTAASVSQDEEATAPLVGYGSSGHGSSRRRARWSSGDRAGDPATPAPSERASEGRLQRTTASAGTVIAKPPIRKLAKDLGVDLGLVTATGPIGDVTRDDVLREATQAGVFHNIQTPEWPETREERIPVKGVRKAIATAMVSSAFTAPHVSVFVDVDATRTMEFVKRLKNSTDFAGVKVSPLLIMAKAMIWAVRRNPTVNSAWTDEEIIVRHYVNLGVAAATPRGLIVPNVKEAQSMSLLELAGALEQLTLTARDGRTPPADMANGTITVTNIGVFGMDTGTPILNPGEVAIVALGTIKQKPWVVDGEVRPRYVTTIGASFDHRVVDGDVASRFTADVAAIMEEPALLLD
ncbi:dihydrolipoamide acetyltransferase family protein [Leifsonia sp. Root112D2]|uniref:dihydrolipoamide acetyltransferase family protein n=1 Tax=Leifsonia sp. Root112D2 TaxID=1736426 RepID=UPI0006F9E324|nr:dihydrolipoamide acetyltransferase family protein [Leifsonia sp. Root112D2]KQV06745.1 branched-chain alpha-keto acid dehydrogenase subunit E2 [Leifsonia sp. Root112D2]